jgi:hexosaminidase
MLKKQTIFLLFILIALTGQSQDCPIFPQPTNFSSKGGEFYFGNMLSVSRQNLSSEIMDDLKWYLTHELEINALFVNNEGQIEFKRIANVPTDYYGIEVGDKITITYSSEASFFYAITSLKQLVQKSPDEYFVPKCSISDEPKFHWRGMHLDVSRHFFTVAEVKQYLDWMARYKFNKFHWHLTDDQGWRIEIKQYPKLTEIGSVREKTLVGHASNSVKTFELKEHKGFYTQKEIKDVIAYAAARHIEVIPEIEMPGHSMAALAAYPEFSCDGKKLPVVGEWGVFDKVFCSKDETITFLQNILEEVVQLFPGQYIHIGGDEAPKTSWKSCDRCQANIKKHNLKSEEELQSYFIKQMDGYLTSKGKKLIGWDEILEGGLSPNAAVMSWRGTKGGIEAAEQNHYVVMTPGSHCYFDHYQSDRRSEPLAIGGFTPLEKVFEFNPIPAELAKDKQGLILGAQANLWTEYISTFDQVEYMVLPRMIALSEVLWGTNTETYEQFLARFKKYEMPYLDKKEVNYSKAAFYLKSEITTGDDGVTLTFDNPENPMDVQISTENPKLVVKGKSNSIKVKRTLRVQKNKVVAISGKGNKADTVTIEILQHSTLGAEWKIEPQASAFYAGKGAFTLTDGIIGGRPWNGKEWLGFDEDRVDLNLDLGVKKRLKSISISCLAASSSWIYLPETIVVRYSKNGRRWKEKSASVTTEVSKILLGRKIRYLELKITSLEKIPEGNSGAGHTPWLFLDEIWMQ